MFNIYGMKELDIENFRNEERFEEIYALVYRVESAE